MEMCYGPTENWAIEQVVRRESSCLSYGDAGKVSIVKFGRIDFKQDLHIHLGQKNYPVIELYTFSSRFFERLCCL